MLLLFWGDQGVGKSIMTDFLRDKIFGRSLAFQTPDVARDLFSHFSGGLANKRLIICDETGDVCTLNDAIKNAVTGATFNYEKKRHDQQTIDSYVNFILTTNNRKTLHVEHSDRRIVAIECSEVHRNDTDYFNCLAEHINKPDTGRCFYEYCVNHLDLTGFDGPTEFQELRPITPFYREMQQLSLSLVDRFFSALVNTWATGDAALVVSKDSVVVYKLYKDTAEYEKATTCMHCSAFGKVLAKMASVRVTRGTAGKKTYHLTIEQMRAELQSRRKYDPDAVLIPS